MEYFVLIPLFGRWAKLSNINFNSVANEAGIAKATLYNNQKFRKRIETLRQQQAQSPTQNRYNAR